MNDLDKEIAHQEELVNRANGDHVTDNILHAQDKDEEQLDNLIRTFRGDGFNFWLSKKRTFDPDFNFVIRLPSDDFDIESIKHHYGGGRYRVKVTDSAGRYKKVFYFGIDESFKGRQEGAAGNTDAVAIAQTVANLAKKEDNSNVIIAMMEKQSQAQTAQLERQQTQGQQFLTLMLQMQAESTKAMMGMMTAMMAKPAPANDNFGTAITPILIKMIESSAAKQQNADMDIDRLVKLRDFLTPAEPEPKGLLDKVLDAAPAMLPLFLGQRGMQAMPPMSPMPLPPMQGDPSSPVGTPPTAALPRPVETATGSPVPVPPAGEAPLPASAIPASPSAPTPAKPTRPKVELVPLLKCGAEADSEPSVYAVIVLDTVGAENEEQLVEFLTKDDGWKVLFQGFSESEMKWVEEWRKEVIEMATESDEDDADESEPDFTPDVKPDVKQQGS